MITPILFLDFDGVMHPASYIKGQNFCCAPWLEAVVAKHELRLVVSSSWRFHYPMDAILRSMPPALAHRVVGTTGDAHIGPWARFHEIKAWLAQNDPLADWRAADDAAFEFPKPCPELIACNPQHGFGARQAGELTLWLRSLGQSG
jgi:hypothetical protein